MGGARKLSLALVAAICAAILAACGGGGDSTATTATNSTAAESTANTPSTPNGSNGGNGGDKSSKGSKGKDGQSGTNGDGGGNGGGAGGESNGGGEASGGPGGSGSIGNSFSGPPTKHKHPAPVEGQRSDSFRVPGGDNSIQEFGEETDAAERVAAMVPIAGLYRALESGDWTAVCSTYLSASNVKQIELLAEKSPQLKGKDCPSVLGGLNQVAGKGPDTPDGGVVSFRVEGDTGFAIYWGIDGKGYAFALKSEGGAWKLTALAPTPLQVG
jgi:hypothetical protein